MIVNPYYVQTNLANNPYLQERKSQRSIAYIPLYNTYNMGIGMVLCVDKDDVDKTIAAVTEAGEDAYVIGEAKAGDKGVDLC